MTRKAGTKGGTARPRWPQNFSLSDVATSFGRQAIHGASCASRQPCHLQIQQTRHITRRLCLYIITICNAHVIDAERARDLCERGRLCINRQNVTGNIVPLRSALQAVPGEVVSAISWTVGTLWTHLSQRVSWSRSRSAKRRSAESRIRPCGSRFLALEWIMSAVSGWKALSPSICDCPGVPRRLTRVMEYRIARFIIPDQPLLSARLSLREAVRVRIEHPRRRHLGSALELSHGRRLHSHSG